MDNHSSHSNQREQLTFIPWLINEIDNQHHPGLQWLDSVEKVASIPWPRARETLPLEELGIMYCWHKHRLGDTHNQNRSPSNIKGIFRAIINSRDEITKLREDTHAHVIHIQINLGASPKLSNQLRARPYINPAMFPEDAPDPILDAWTGAASSQPAAMYSEENSPASTIEYGTGRQYRCSTSSSDSTYTPTPYYIFYTAPTWAQKILTEEQDLTDASCSVYVSVYSRGNLLSQKRCDLQHGLLIYSDTCEIDFESLSDDICERKYGRGSKTADKLFINEIQQDINNDLYEALRNFNRGVMVSTNNVFDVLVQRLCIVRTYFGHSNQGGCVQMQRPNHLNNLAISPVFSYMGFLEMAGYLMKKIHDGSPINRSDEPTEITYIAVGQEWTPTCSIHSLPLLIEIKHERAVNFKQANLSRNSELRGNTTNSAIVVSVTDSLDLSTTKKIHFDEDMMSRINSEQPLDDIDMDFINQL